MLKPGHIYKSKTTSYATYREDAWDFVHYNKLRIGTLHLGNSFTVLDTFHGILTGNYAVKIIYETNVVTILLDKKSLLNDFEQVC
jgi:hypothetical protein